MGNRRWGIDETKKQINNQNDGVACSEDDTDKIREDIDYKFKGKELKNGTFCVN